MKKSWTTLAACALALVGCERLADADSQGPAIATLQGTLTLAPGMQPPKGELHLSILWHGPDVVSGDGACGPNESVKYSYDTSLFEQKLELETDFPAAFSVKLTEPPPSSALQPILYAETAAQEALGELVVYRDVNGNGRLDRRGFDKPSVDVVIGWGWGPTVGYESGDVDVRISYLTEELKAEGDNAVARKAGYSLELRGYDPATEQWYLRYEPLNGETSIAIELDATSYLQQLACEEACVIQEANDCPDLADLPPIPEQWEPALGDTGNWYLNLTEGDRTITFDAFCLRGSGDEMTGTPREVLSVWHSTQEGCTFTSSYCEYERSDLPDGAEFPWPCTESQDLVFPRGLQDRAVGNAAAATAFDSAGDKLSSI